MLRPHQKLFLEAYGLLGNLTAAAKACKIDKRRHVDWMKEEEYPGEFAKAKEHYCDLLREELRTRVFKGIPEPVIYQGQLQFEPLRRNGAVVRDKNGVPRLSNVPLVVYKKSDVLLMFEAKKHMPEYREHYNHEHTGAAGAPLKIEIEFVKPDRPASTE